MKKQRILFIGAGRMAEAIFSGLLQKKADLIDEIIITNRTNKQRLQEMKEQYHVTISHNWKENVKNSDVIILAMPPKDHSELLKELSPLLAEQFVITVAAGIGIGLLEEHLPENTPVAWVMPNTAADIGESISLYTVGSNVQQEHRVVLEEILDGIGQFEECTEQQILELTAITGSAPAFQYLFAEILESIAAEYGINQARARKLVIQMIYGSASMLKGGTEPAELRNQVTSPGGATAAGLRVLEEKGFYKLIKEAIEATNARAKELGEE
jgi:pyrroline-5-carboxylate reductase